MEEYIKENQQYEVPKIYRKSMKVYKRKVWYKIYNSINIYGGVHACLGHAGFKKYINIIHLLFQNYS